MPIIQGILTVKSSEGQEKIPLKGIHHETVWTLHDDKAVKYRFEFQNQLLKYDKVSQETLQFMFDVKKDTKAWYGIENRQIEFRVITKNLVVDNHNLFVSYELYQGDTHLNSIKFSLECELLEEA